ncbi:hypothetical protein PoB_007355500 [Plakobranchus ocellatus]|uniref:Uncharacterized protein n=1 Tax=Plakobranchus ocellatus TaxID=259542 RepID=A0AAV4DSC3_9GAST|nr:hypothetical protein PoB_007355500 [Plakobranchus ocellatus]
MANLKLNDKPHSTNDNFMFIQHRLPSASLRSTPRSTAALDNGISQEAKQDAQAEDLLNYLSNIKKVVPKIDVQKIREFKSKLNAGIDAALSEIEGMDRKDIPRFITDLLMNITDTLVISTRQNTSQ